MTARTTGRGFGRIHSIPRLLEYDLFGEVTIGQLLGLIVVWFAYFQITGFLAIAVQHDPGNSIWPGWHSVLQGYIPDLERAPPLARFDSVWYLSVAIEGYPGMTGRAINNGAVLPLYGLSMRWVSHALGMDPLWAGIWVSRWMLLATMVMLFAHARRLKENRADPWAPVAAMLCFPTAYIMVSVYSEALFVALSLAALLLFVRRRFVLSAIALSLSAITRLHVLALAPALGIMGSQYWNEQKRSPRALLAFLPPVSVAATLVAGAWYCKVISGDPLLHLHRKMAFGMTDGGPLTALRSGAEYFRRAIDLHTFGSLYTLLEMPCLVGLVVATTILVYRREWASATFVFLSLAMNLRAGTLWGLPRYVIQLWPVFLLIGPSRRSAPPVWIVYVVAGILFQAFLMINYVNLRGPAP